LTEPHQCDLTIYGIAIVKIIPPNIPLISEAPPNMPAVEAY